jgi:RimJ/RimL family protein N-acetyltransferase
VFRVLEGKNVNLRVMEKEDLPLFAEWYNNPDFMGEARFPTQRSMAETEKAFLEPNPNESKRFIIEKKNGTKIGTISHFNMLSPVGKLLEIGYALIPSERGKGYCTEATQLMVDYLFLSKEAPRIQALTLVKNIHSQRVLERVGFKREGIMRKCFYIRGEWSDFAVFSILREEWKEPKILKDRLKTAAAGFVGKKKVRKKHGVGMG